MNGELQMHDSVALLEDTNTKHFETGQPVRLRRGQVGTVVMPYDNGMYEVEFADRDGRAYALLPLAPDKLMALRDAPEFARSGT